MSLRNGFEVRPLAGGDYELVPTQFLFAVAKSEDLLWDLAERISVTVAEFQASQGEE